jgi:hypothetical protein
MASPLRRLASNLLLRRGYAAKESTGIVGLPVVENSREVLAQLSRGILKAVAKLPETAHYRRAVEAVYTERLQACQAHSDPSDVEAALGVPVRAVVAHDKRIARAVDAGLLTGRLPGNLQRSLRHVA